MVNISMYDYMKGFKPLVDLDKELKDGIEFHPLYSTKPVKGIVNLCGFNETYTNKAKIRRNKENG